ncbi:MAG: carbonate dehydratase [Chlorobiales bacterium]|jgi:carbonic anhydrase|nr:carbonate dehydratase [Chlorobiales bacterium]
MEKLPHLFENNRNWAKQITASDPAFFENLIQQQSPEHLWIGCSDSRVPANQIVGLPPGELFVHRNVGNLVVHSDMNCLSVIQYAVDVLKIKHIMVVGHYGCGGIKAALDNNSHGLIDNWLRHIRDIYYCNRLELEKLEDMDKKVNRMCELNVMEQVLNVAKTTIVQDAWARGQDLTIHGWMYSIEDGLLKDMGICLSCLEEFVERVNGESPQFYIDPKTRLASR